ncbi:PucR family transcriptional regulator ligand-binding domain-containing protein [Moorellaceae bacterium AZ2]
MGITVREALRLGGLREGKVLAGFGGLDNLISSVSVIEVPEPDAAAWYRGEELMITAFYSVRENVNAQVRIVQTLAQHKCAGLVVCHQGVYLKEICPEVIDVANALNFPLIVVPKEVAYIDIITPVLEEIINRQKKELEYTLTVQKKLSQIILDGKNIHELAKEIAAILECSLLIIDRTDNMVAKASHNLQGYLLLNKIIRDGEIVQELTKRYRDQASTTTIEGHPALVNPLWSGENYLGKLILFLHRPLEKLESIAVNEACDAIKMVLLQEIARKEETLRSIREFLDELLSGSIQKEEIAISRAEYLNLEIPPNPTVMLIEIRGYETLYRRGVRSDEECIKKKQLELIESVKSVLTRLNHRHIVFPRGNLLIVILAGTAESHPETITKSKEIGEKVLKEIGSVLGSLSALVGIGNQCGKLTDLHKSFSEALRTINIGKVLFGDNQCIHVADLGLYYYLPELLTNQNVTDYVNRAINKLKEYDAKKGTSLFETLKVLLEEEDVTRAAERLFVHRNTLLYRKEKITKVLGIDPFVQPYKLNFQLTLFLAELRKVCS